VIVTVASFGLASTMILGLLLWRRREEHVSRRAPFLFTGIAVVYGFQLRYGITLKNTPDDLSALRTSAGLMLGLYAIGVARSWELLGARDFGLLDVIRPKRHREPPHSR
jgi:hypothetical protein